ncbi:MAG TPA: SDR family oxidoreductase [Steroidobacteraceae bacterium]|nr:SDR family oxidoreductase [Steroidobacteraceae bacterium]
MLSLMQPVLSCLVVGCGYVGSRLARREAGTRPVLAIVRSGSSATSLQSAGVNTMRLDLDAAEPDLQPSLATAANGADVVYLVPPPEAGTTDPRLENFLRQLGEAVPAVLVYVSTTGVYGDTGGAPVDESAPVAPGNDRARRRLAAESAATAWCAARGVRCVVLRVPGIYGPHRLPLERLERGEPALRPEEAGPGNRIHVDDLVAAIVAAIDQPSARGAYNASDGDHSSTTAYLQETAAAAGLPAPRLVTKAEAARQISPGMLAYLLESRRVDNRRLVEELGVRLHYPRMQAGILASLAEMRVEESQP